MTETHKAPDQTLLRQLLKQTPTDPAAAARELSRERSQLLAQRAFGAELLGNEQRWLQGFHKTGSAALREDLLAVPCVNAERPWVHGLATMVREPALR